MAAGGLPMEEDPPLPPSDPPPVPSFAPDLASDPPPPPPPLPPSFQSPAAQEPYDPFAAAEPQRGGPDISSMAAAGGKLQACKELSILFAGHCKFKDWYYRLTQDLDRF